MVEDTDSVPIVCAKNEGLDGVNKVFLDLLSRTLEQYPAKVRAASEMASSGKPLYMQTLRPPNRGCPKSCSSPASVDSLTKRSSNRLSPPCILHIAKVRMETCKLNYAHYITPGATRT